MKFIEITENLKATPGEYIYHVPTKQIVVWKQKLLKMQFKTLRKLSYRQKNAREKMRDVRGAVNDYRQFAN